MVKIGEDVEPNKQEEKKTPEEINKERTAIMELRTKFKTSGMLKLGLGIGLIVGAGTPQGVGIFPVLIGVVSILFSWRDKQKLMRLY